MTSPHKISISSEQKRIEELEEALVKIDGEAPAHEPAADEPNVGAPRNWSAELAEYVQEIVQQAFEEGKTRGRWEAAVIARAALSNSQPKGE